MISVAGSDYSNFAFVRILLGTEILANAESWLLLDFYGILRSMFGDLETEKFVDCLQRF